MKAEAEAMLRSVDNSAAGRDYPEGIVLQPPRNAFWRDMPEYKSHLETFSNDPSRPGSNKKSTRSSKRKKTKTE
jgi:hypothetical protein